MSKTSVTRLLSFLLILWAPVIASAETPAPAAPGPTPLQAKIETSMGNFVVELDQEKAPKTVENFIAYAQEGAYTGTIFHRVINGFMIQGGGFTAKFDKKPTRAPIPNEADNGLKNLRGTIVMARTSNPHSATNQFFINLVDNDFLNHRSPTGRGWGYAVFGRVVEGMNVVDEIGNLPTGPGGPFRKDAPLNPVEIRSITLIGGGNDAPKEKS